jgi:hypothetical protein
MEATMAHVASISAKSQPKQDLGGDKAPLKPLAEIAASTIPFHPIANIFRLLEGDEFEELVKDVRANGLVQPIILYEEKILDGRNRYRACLKSGVAPIFNTFSGDDPVAYVISTNVRRRHMTPKRKQEALAKLFKLKPELSARQAANLVGASPTTASETRKKLVKQGDVSKLDTSVDTKGRRQPRSKNSTSKSKSNPVADDRPEPKGGQSASTQSPTPVEIKSPPTAAPAARKHPMVCEAVDRLVEALGAIQFVDAVRELTQDERKALSSRVDTARRYLGQLKEVLQPARAVS